MLEGLKERFESIFSSLGKKGKLSQEDIENAAREIRRALLEADVNFKLAKQITESIKQRAAGQEVAASITPSRQIFAIVYEELIKIMGDKTEPLKISPKPPTIYMLVGLQGSGKTTTSVKIARRLRLKGHKPLLAACDLRRPAAAEQLKILAEANGLSFFGSNNGQDDPIDVAKASIKYASDRLCDLVILDTSGRLQADAELMKELEDMASAVSPTETLLVVDAMTGQEAVDIAQSFGERVPITGAVLTKLDGDARGGASLSIKAVTGIPIKLVGCGEKTDELEIFDPARMAQRITGMGDLQGLLEKIRTADLGDAEKLAEDLQSKRFTLEDFLQQLRQIQKLGALDKLMEMLPIPAGAGKALKNAEFDPKRVRQSEAIILSMTKQERLRPEIIKGSRRKRIANGSGTSVQQVNQLLASYNSMKQMTKVLGGTQGGKMKKLSAMMKGFGKRKFF